MFDDEPIRAREGSAQRLSTIKKHKPDRLDLEHKRLKQLQLFNRTLGHIKHVE
ncbi:hypothetical protein ACMHYB_52590 [Sorangium sp. So ce1128]